MRETLPAGQNRNQIFVRINVLAKFVPILIGLVDPEVTGIRRKRSNRQGAITHVSQLFQFHILLRKSYLTKVSADHLIVNSSHSGVMAHHTAETSFLFGLHFAAAHLTVILAVAATATVAVVAGNGLILI